MGNLYTSGRTANIYVTPTISAGAYTANFQVGPLFKIALATFDIGQGAVLQHLSILDKAKQDAELEIWLFNQSVTLASSNNQAFDVTGANCAGKKIGVIKTKGLSYEDAASISNCTVSPIGLSCQPLPKNTSQDLYGVIVTRGTPTYGSTTGLELCFGFLQDL